MQSTPSISIGDQYKAIPWPCPTQGSPRRRQARLSMPQPLSACLSEVSRTSWRNFPPVPQGPEKHTNRKEYFRKRGSTFYRRFPAAGPPSTTGFRWVWAGFSTIRDPKNSLLCTPFLYVPSWRLNPEKCRGHVQCKRAQAKAGMSWSKFPP